ncbi:hypothetical protein [Citricoccus nitrophenolicus]|uniref:hypothetical protein n=1 Tax=Citricoccus nitrophenolicus TaxID=863575 RepID=UPI0031E8FDEA
MCRALVDGGARCPVHLAEAIENIAAEIEYLDERIEDNEAFLDIANLTLESDEGIEDIDEIVRDTIIRRAELTKRLDKEKRRFNATKTGRALLNEKLADESLTESQRQETQAALAQAEVDYEEEMARRELMFLKQDSLRAELSKQGVKATEIDAIIWRGTRGKGNPHPRSYNYYARALANAENRLDAENSKHEENNAAIFEQDYSEKEEAKALDAEEARHEKAVAELQRVVSERKLARDSTVPGRAEVAKRAEASLDKMRSDRDHLLYQAKINFNAKEKMALIDKANKLTLRHARGRAKFAQQMSELKSLHKAGMSDRKHHELTMKQIREASRLAGGDPDAAVKAWQKPDRTIVPPTSDPMLRSAAISVHVTEADYARLQESYALNGSDYPTFGAWASTQVRRNPASLMAKESVEEANDNFKLHDEGKKGRHTTHQEEVDGVTTSVPRNTILRIPMTVRDKETVKMRAATVRDATSSFAAKMLRGDNPVKFQNDRSFEERQKKAKQCREVVANLVAA